LRLLAVVAVDGEAERGTECRGSSDRRQAYKRGYSLRRGCIGIRLLRLLRVVLMRVLMVLLLLLLLLLRM